MRSKMSKDSQIFINSRGDGGAGAPSTIFQSLIYPASDSPASLSSIPPPSSFRKDLTHPTPNSV